MATTNYIDRATKFIRMIHPYIKNCDWPIQFKRAVMRFNNEHNRSVHVRYGATRVVLITSDYVIKLDYGDDLEECGGCYDEYEMWLYAQEEGMSYLFAPTTPVRYENTIYYVMPRIRGIGRYRCSIYRFLTAKEWAWLDGNVCDMHDENYGWRNGRPIIVDYAYHPV